MSEHATVEHGDPARDGAGDAPLWTPEPSAAAHSRLSAFASWLVQKGYASAVDTADYSALWTWSVAYPDRLWKAVWRFCGVVADTFSDGRQWEDVVVGLERMAPPDEAAGPRWFTHARLNFAENLLRWDDDRPAIASWTERGRRGGLSHAQLRTEVARVAAALRAHGIRPGDRVAGFLPNIAEAVVAMLATASIGAVWSSCSPDFGVNGVFDRFGQIAPRVLVTADAYVYNAREIGCLDRVREIVDRIASIERVIVVPFVRESPDVDGIRDAAMWSDIGPWGLRPPTGQERTTAVPPLVFERLPFDHPLYVMYSSGTTGLPKCMVHGAGGTLLQHLKEHQLHCDLSRDDVFFYFTTCGWMMWNWLVSGLASGCTLVLYDGAPLAPRKDMLWDMAAAERISVFGTSAKYLAILQKEGLRPVNAFIDKLTGGTGTNAEVEQLLELGEESLGLNDFGGAAQAYAHVLSMEPENEKAIAGMARVYLAGGDADQARQTIAMAPQDSKEPAVQSVRAQLSLASSAPTGETEALRARVAADPSDHQARYDLSLAQAASGDLKGAVDSLLAIVQDDREWNEQAARKQLLVVFEAAGATSDVAKDGRRRLSSILFA